MSGGRKLQKKRLRQPSPPSPPSSRFHITNRLKELRRSHRNLWDDEDDEDDNTTKKQRHSKEIIPSRLYIALSDSDSDEDIPTSPPPPPRDTKSTKKRSRSYNEDFTTKNPTCLICSILSQLSSQNCCSEHLSILKRHAEHQQRTTNTSWLPENVMIVPVTDDALQRSLNPQQAHQLRTQAKSVTPKDTNVIHNKRSTTRKSTRSSNKIARTPNRSQVQQLQRNILNSSTESSNANAEPLASSIIIESSAPCAVKPDGLTRTMVTETSSISVTNNVEDTTSIDNRTSKTASIELIVIDDTSNGNETEHQTAKSRTDTEQDESINGEISAVLQQIVIQVDSSNATPLEFTPATARRTDTEVMAALLPKIPLKQGRFRCGKPIKGRKPSNITNEPQPVTSAQASVLPTTSITNTICSSLVTDTREKNFTSTSNETSISSENHIDNSKMAANSCIFTQDENNELSRVSLSITEKRSTDPMSKPISNETFRGDLELNHLANVGSSITNERTPTRLSYRLNPDGTRVSISRPVTSTSHHSLRRTSTDVTPIQPNTKQV